MIVLTPPLVLALGVCVSAILTGLAALVWSIRRKP
jgi:hypothetical protein